MLNVTRSTEGSVPNVQTKDVPKVRTLEQSVSYTQSRHFVQEMNAVADLLQSVQSRWWLAGGAAVDLYAGGQFRSHHDVDVVFPRRAIEDIFNCLRQRGCEFFDEETWLVLDDPSRFKFASSVFVRDICSHPGLHSALNVIFVDEGACGGFVFARDPSLVFASSLHLESHELHIESGMAVHLVPKEVLLLYKLCERRQKDLADIQRLLPTLTDRERKSLHNFLRRLGIVFEVQGQMLTAPEALVSHLSHEPFEPSEELLSQVAAQENDRIKHAANLIFDCAAESRDRESFLARMPGLFSKDIVERRLSEFCAAAEVLFAPGEGMSKNRFSDLFNSLFDLSNHFGQLVPRWKVHFNVV